MGTERSFCLCLLRWHSGKQLLANAGDAREVGSIPGSGRSPGEGNGNSLQYSCLENSMDRGTWWTTVHGVAKSWTQAPVFLELVGHLVSRRQDTAKG